MTVSPSLPAARPTGPAPAVEDPATGPPATAETFARAMSAVAGDRPADQPADRPADQPADQPATDPAPGPEPPTRARASRRSRPGDCDQPAGPGDGFSLGLPAAPAVPGPAAAPIAGSTGGPAERPGPGDVDALRVGTEPVAAQPAAASPASGASAGAATAGAAGEAGPAPAFPGAAGGPVSSGAPPADPAAIGAVAAGRSLAGVPGPTTTDANPGLPVPDAGTLAAAIRLGAGDDAAQVTVAALAITPGVGIAGGGGPKPSPLAPSPFAPPALAPGWPILQGASTSAIAGPVPTGTALPAASSPGSDAGLPTASPAPAQPGSGGPISPAQLAAAYGPPAATVGTGPGTQPVAGIQAAIGPGAAAAAAVAGPTGPVEAGVGDPTARSSAPAAAQVDGGSGTSRRPEAVPGLGSGRGGVRGGVLGAAVPVTRGEVGAVSASGDGARPGDLDPAAAADATPGVAAAVPADVPAAMPGVPAPQRVLDSIQSGTGSSAAGTAPATPAAIAAQVARQVTGLRTLTDGTQHTVLHLNPDHLGALTLTIDVRGGQVTLGIAGDQGTLSTLGQGLDRLRDQLAQSGLGLGDVSMRPDPSSANGRAAPDGQPSPFGQSSADPGRGGRGETPRDPAPGNQAPGLGFGPGDGPGSRGGPGRPAPGAQPVPDLTGDGATDRFDLRV